MLKTLQDAFFNNIWANSRRNPWWLGSIGVALFDSSGITAANEEYFDLSLRDPCGEDDLKRMVYLRAFCRCLMGLILHESLLAFICRPGV